MYASDSAKLIWTRPQRGARGPQRAHDHVKLAIAAIRIADAEGIEHVSMRRIAAELGAGATSLYRYVAKKDDLFDLMLDTVMGERRPPRPTGDWRADLGAIAHQTRKTMLRHPWTAALSAFRPALGPGSLRWIEATLSVVDGRGLDIEEMMLLANTVMFFVRGYVTSELAEDEAMRRSGLDQEGWMAARVPYGRLVFESGEFPLVARVMREASSPHAKDRQERGFADGFDRVLDGIAAQIAKKPKRASPVKRSRRKKA